jgi:ornithine cyclodeaminase/alanine dehydrogenase-like protein (mu-crystallin family)
MRRPAPARLLSQRDVARLLDLPSCIDAVERVFRLHHEGKVLKPGVLGTHALDGGFHAKTAGMLDDRSYFAAKLNANFPGNPVARALPTIQGLVLLFDATNGVPLAIMDSIEITRLRTAAASAVAAKYASRKDSRVVSVIGCGAQAVPHVAALIAVRPIDRVLAFDVRTDRAILFAHTVRTRHGIDAAVVDDHRYAARTSDIVVTCTPAREPILGNDDLPPGVFVAAVGADSEEKQEIDSSALAACIVIADIVDQCATIGELHHAIAAGTMSLSDVRSDLAGVVSGERPARLSATERVVFDSTGTALQDVAAAALAYERACAQDVGMSFTLADMEVV